MEKLGKALAIATLAAAGAVVGGGLATEDGESFIRRDTLATAAILWLMIAVVSYVGLRFLARPGAQADAPQKEPKPPSQAQMLIGYLGGFAAMTVLGVLIITQRGEHVLDLIGRDPLDIAVGLFAAIPPALFLSWLMRTEIGVMVRFREKQIELFRKRGLKLGWFTIVVISLGAGVSEEIFFRGAIQDWASDRLGLPLGLAIGALAFGLGHAANLGYFLISAIIGVYLGALFLGTGALLAPIVAHFAYDVYAFALTARALRQPGPPSTPEAPL